jgi:aspartate/methionine/tyrosine aminotransferase
MPSAFYRGVTDLKIDSFGVEEWMNKYETGARINVAETCVEPISAAELLRMAPDGKEILEKILSSQLTYGAIEGSIELRKEVCKLYKKAKRPENIVVTNGGIGANFLAMFTLLSPGDEVVAIYPTYQQLYSLPEAFGARVRRLRLEPSDGYMPNMEKLRTLVTGGTKAIIMNSPNNPTGALFPEAILREIVKIAERAGAWILSDEVYRGLEHGASYGTPSMTDLYDRAIATSGMSKVYSLAGIRLGWITAPEEFIRECLRHRDYTTISCGMIVDTLALTALKNKEALLARNLAIVEENAAILDNWVKGESRISYVKPKAGTTALIEYEASIDSEEYCRRMYRETGAFVVPGNCFEFEHCFRIGYAQNRKTLEEGLAAISKFMKTL